MENQKPKWRTKNQNGRRTKNQNGQPKTKMDNQKPKWRTKMENQNGEPKAKMENQKPCKMENQKMENQKLKWRTSIGMFGMFMHTHAHTAYTQSQSGVQRLVYFESESTCTYNQIYKVIKLIPQLKESK